MLVEFGVVAGYGAHWRLHRLFFVALLEVGLQSLLGLWWVRTIAVLLIDSVRQVWKHLLLVEPFLPIGGYPSGRSGHGLI